MSIFMTCIILNLYYVLLLVVLTIPPSRIANLNIEG